uniref:Spike glycoprotein n=1 Tax=Ball python nidovirus TaxID=1986118 RepID=A0A2I7UGT6_9NIDO|nr:spike glycoprotein [Ball python nidovirus 1]
MKILIFCLFICLASCQPSVASRPRKPTYRNWETVYSIDHKAKTITTQGNFDEFKNVPYLTSYVDPTLEPVELARFLQNNVITGVYNAELPKPVILELVSFDKPENKCQTVDPPHYYLIQHQGRKYFFNKQTLIARVCYVNGLWRPTTSEDKDKCEKVSPQVYQDFKPITTGRDNFESTPYFYVANLPQINQYATRIDREDTCCYYHEAPIVFSKGTIATCSVKTAFKGIRKTISNTRSESVFVCTCPQRCTMFLNVITDVVIADGKLLQSTYALRDLNNVAQQFKLFQQQLQGKSVKVNNKTITDESINIIYHESEGRCGVGRVKIGCGLTTFTFVSSLYLIHGPMMPNSLSKMYCTTDRLDVQDITRPTESVNFEPPATVQLGNTRFIATGTDATTNELILIDDPQFISPTMTVKPTVGSCSTSGGYKWAGNFTIVKDPGDIPDCPASNVDQDWTPVCNVTKLEPLQKVYVVDKKVHARGVNCDDICPSATVCNSNQKRSPLYQACVGIASDINRLLDVEMPTSVKLEAITSGEVEDSLTLEFQQTVAEIQNVKLQETVTNGLNNADTLRKLFEETVALPKDETFFPDRSQAAKDLGLFNNAMYNSPKDMDHISAFPWLAGWRFGRQINALSYTTSILITAYDEMQKTVNSNFQGLATAVKAVNTQVKANYEAVTTLYNLIKQTHDAYGNDLRKVGYQLSEVEYMAAKLALVNQYFTKVLSRQTQLVTESQLFDLRVGTCRSRNPTCFGGQGTYLSHAEFETPRQRVLIVNYLGSKERCKQIFIANKICTGKGLAQVAPFGCRFEKQYGDDDDYVLTNYATGGVCHAPLINIQDCQLPEEDLQKLQLDNYQESLQLGFREVNYTKVQFTEKIENITKFNNDINKIVESTRAVKSLNEIVSETVMLSLKNVLAQINAWSIWDIAKWFLIAFAIAIVGMFVVSALKFVAAIFIAVKTNKS